MITIKDIRVSQMSNTAPFITTLATLIIFIYLKNTPEFWKTLKCLLPI